ncbi:MAG: ABC transporter permease, partial [Pseudoclavibacter sp.]
GCGALIAQYQGFADISMGIGLILVGLASVILGQAIFGNSSVIIATIGVIVGAVLYRLVIFAALSVGLDPNDMKLISAVLVVIALLLPMVPGFGRLRVIGNWRKPPPGKSAVTEVLPTAEGAQAGASAGTGSAAATAKGGANA